MIKKLLGVLYFIALIGLSVHSTFAQNLNEVHEPGYLKAAIITETAIEVQRSNIFDASQSFIPDPAGEIRYLWDFGDGNKNEGIEVIHVYKNPGKYIVTLTVADSIESSKSQLEIFVYNKLITLITDQTQDQDSIEIFQNIASKNGVFLKIIESFGSSTEFISEEILTKKLTEHSSSIQKASEIIVWTKENAGLNSLSRFIKNNSKNSLNKQLILVVENDIENKKSAVQRQFSLLNPKLIIISKQATIDDLITTNTTAEFLSTLSERGREFEVIDAQSGKIHIWNFMNYFVNFMINSGIPDNTIALLLLLPFIATVVAFMRQVVGVTTFGIYTPSIITLSFLIIGIYAGLLTLAIAVVIAFLAKNLLKYFRMLFVPKMAIVIILVSLTLFVVLITSIYLDLFDATFLSIAIFPMLILSTLVEKLISSKGEKSFLSASIIMLETLIVSIIAYFLAGGEINFGAFSLKFDFIKRMLLDYPETILLLLLANIVLGKWTGLRILEHIRFREVLRNIEE